ncbi:hypothetical protein Desdi_0951 [Desulfitobacterium dichloroeliminans LMG P-21439]|uniref:Ion channel n=1 Tax=Desulfitobacterium dichloroeliminans (strain LMG P-21439 / DCA1) TaxID=871963 RepID=L0F604_DESDL|nr:hypothetical protein [Desulfitobacterium dichloroeliminans]AGA68470.1 hypothetical protein Desdi_0951 [Desulfitobacterium dichloroeliminans LMG P-21439]
MYGSLGEYPLYPDSYPSSYPGPSFLGHIKRVAPILSQEAERINAKITAASNVWLLAPAMVGTAAYSLFTTLFRGLEGENGKVLKGKIGSVIYSAVVTAGLSSYVYSVLVVADGHLMDIYWPIAGAIAVQILYFASVYTWLYRLDKSSFTDNIEDNPIEEIITFLYFSITTFATTGSSVFPESITAKGLVALQVLFLIYSFTMGLVFFINP